MTFAAPKVAHVFPPASRRGRASWWSTDLGIPPELVEQVEEERRSCTCWPARSWPTCCRRADAGAHKGDYGHALLVAGSPGKAGAAVLAARGAVRAGAGLVTAAVPEPVAQTWSTWARSNR